MKSVLGSGPVCLTEYVLRVIKQVLPIRHSLRVLRQSNRRAMKSVVVLAVLELLANPLTDHDLSHIRVDTQVSPVRERVKVASQEDAVGQFVFSAIYIRSNVRCFQDWKRSLPGDGASLLIGIHHQYAERSLR
jgi:hypothetical protein